MVERSLSMREVRGSIPRTSKNFFYIVEIILNDFNDDNEFKQAWGNGLQALPKKDL